MEFKIKSKESKKIQEIKLIKIESNEIKNFFETHFHIFTSIDNVKSFSDESVRKMTPHLFEET